MKSLKTAEQEEQREILALKRLDAENLQIRFVFRLLVRRLFKYVITQFYLHFTEVPLFNVIFILFSILYSFFSSQVLYLHTKYHFSCLSSIFLHYFHDEKIFFMAI